MNSVDIIGILKEKIDDNYRYFEYELPYLDEPKEGPNIIVIKNWTNQPNSRLLVLQDGTRVALHGHLDTSEKFGTILSVIEVQALR